jgi:hypothetical protein
LTSSDVQRQVDLYRECLEKELEDDPECRGNYYILYYDFYLSQAMPDLVRQIENREKRKLE